MLTASKAVSPDHTTDEGATEPGGDATTPADRPGDRVVDVLGFEIVIEEDFVAFPWRAGIKRAPVAFAAVLVVVLLLAAVGGLDGNVPLVDQLAVVGIVAYNAHNIHAATALIPKSFVPVAEPVIGLPVVGRLVRGLFAIGQNHLAPVAHVVDIAGGKTGTIGHVNFIQQQGRTDVPSILYYLVPVVVLVGAGYEFADSYWDEAATDSPLEVTRFGIALGVGYALTLLAGTLVFTIETTSPLSPKLFTVLPDRYLTLVFGFVYPAVLGSVGAAVVYVRRELGDASGSEAGGEGG